MIKIIKVAHVAFFTFAIAPILFSCQKNPPTPNYSGCDSVRLGIIHMRHADSIRLSHCLVLSLADSLNLFPEMVLSNGLVAYYPFNGNANDESGNGNNGTVTGAKLVADRKGINNSAYYFDGMPGTSIQTNYTGVLGSQSRSISVWVRRSLRLYNNTYVLTYGNLDPNYNLQNGSAYCVVMSGLGAGGQQFVGIDNGASQIGNYFTGVSDNKWHNYIFVYDNNIGPSITDIRIYIDGTLAQNDFAYNPKDINTISQIKLVIGEYWKYVDPRTFLGDIDDIRIYNRVLKADEISYLSRN